MIVFTVIGIATVAAFALLLVLGLCGLYMDNRKRRRFEDESPPFRSQLTPLVPQRRRPTDDDLRDIPPQ